MTDTGHQYALDVVEGNRHAGPLATLACQRYLNDLDNPKWWINEAKVQDFFDFCESMLFLPDGSPLVLYPYQKFLIRNLIGFCKVMPKRDEETGEIIHDESGEVLMENTFNRRFRTAFILGGRGCAKTTAVSAFGIYSLLKEKWPCAGYIMAATADQARIPIDQMAQFIRANPRLDEELNVLGGSDKRGIAYHRNGGFIHRVATHARAIGKSGTTPSVVLIDECSQLDSAEQMDTYIDSAAKRPENSLVFITTNAGTHFDTVVGKEYEAGKAILEGKVEDDSAFVYICNIDDRDAELVLKPTCPEEDEDRIIAYGNPAYPHQPTPESIKQRLHTARTQLSKQPGIMRGFFCQFTQASNPFVDPAWWRAAEELGEKMEAVVDKENAPLHLAVDLSKNTDLTSIAAVWTLDDGSLYAEVTSWLPKDGVDRFYQGISRMAPIHEFIKKGELRTGKGKVINLREIVEFIIDEYIEKCNGLVGLVCDSFRRNDFLFHFEEMGISCNLGLNKENCDIAFGLHDSGFYRFSHALAAKGKQDEKKLYGPPAVDEIEKRLIEQTIGVKANGPLRWASVNAAVESNHNEDRRIVKSDSKAKIDPFVALLFAVSFASRRAAPEIDVGEWFDGFLGQAEATDPVIRV